MKMDSIHLCDCFSFLRKCENKVYDVTFTSPPYNRKRNDTYKHYNDTLEDYFSFLETLTNELLRVTKGDVLINIQSNMYNKVDVYKWQGFFADKIKGCVMWCKTNPTPSCNYDAVNDKYSITNAYEYFFVLNGHNASEFKANTKIKNYIESSVNQERFSGHSAVMKYSIAEHFIKNFTNPGDIVFDPFMGCGTTALACLLNDRHYEGCEICQQYLDIANHRLSTIPKQLDLFSV